jgi:hypothetical protein
MFAVCDMTIAVEPAAIVAFAEAAARIQRGEPLGGFRTLSRDSEPQ